MATLEQRQKPWISTLRDKLGDEVVSTEPEDLETHSKNEGYQEDFPPECVVFAHSKEDIIGALRVAREHGVPVTPYGAGSSLEGNSLPVKAGISLDLTRMDRILSIDPESLTVTVEAGVLREELNRRLHEHGLLFPVDPGANATLGGMAGTNASGANALLYGSFREQVLELEVVLSDGRVLKLGSGARKNSSGYDLKNLFVGSEGTLGIITELTLRAYPSPPETVSLRALFSEIESAVEAAVKLVRAGLSISRLEMVDAECVRAVNRYESADYPEQPTLWVEFQGRSEEALDEEVKVAQDLCEEAGAEDITVAHNADEQERLWEARHHAWYAVDDYYTDHQLVSTDTCVPVARLSEAIASTQQLMHEHSLVAPIIGHVGDGNYHVFFHLAPDDEDGWQRLGEVLDGMVEKALELEGTSTGEHGVGLRKIKYQEQEHGEALSVMREVKELLDPSGILNPAKVLPSS